MNDKQYKEALLKAEQDYTANDCCKMSECTHFKLKHMKNSEIGYYEIIIYHPIKKEWLVFINSPSFAQRQLNLLHDIFHKEISRSEVVKND